MNFTDISIRRPVTIIMVFFIILILGVVSLSNLAVDLFPDIELPVAITMITYEGVGPEEIEKIVTKPIEGQLSTLSGIENLQSISSSGMSVVVTQFAWGTNMDTAMVDLRDKVNLIKPMLPEEVQEPIIMKLDLNAMPIVIAGITGQYELDQLEKIVENDIAPRLERIPGVASVNISGGRTREIKVEIDPYKLNAYNLTLNDIIQTIAAENHNVSIGHVEEGEKDYLVRVKGEFTSLDSLENVLIPLKTGETIELKYLAEGIIDGYADISGYALINGQQTISLTVSKESDANTVSVSEKVNQELEKIQKEMEGKISIAKAMDQADYINDAIDNVANNGIKGALLACFILFLFLRNFRSTLIIATAIPISVITTFVLMYFGDLTLNLISLGGLALGVGMMVDNAIVILENIYRYRQNGYNRIDSARDGANEVSLAIVASTLTTVAVFLPIVFVEGIASQIFRPMALTVSFSLLASLTVALTLVPMLCSKYLRVETNGNGTGGFFNKLSKKWLKVLDAINARYEVLLKWSMGRRKTVIFISLIAFIISVALIPMVGMEFIPETDTGMFTLNIELPPNTVLERTEKVVMEVEKIMSEIPEVQTIFTMAGNTGMNFHGGSTTNQATIYGQLVPLNERQRDINQVVDEVRQRTQSIPGAQISISVESMVMGSTSPISLTIKGEELDVLEDLANQIAEKVKQVPGTREVTTSFEEGNPEISVYIDRQKAAQYGVSSYQAASSLRSALQGVVASKYRTGGEEIDIKVLLSKEARTNIEDLKRLMVPSLRGFNVPLEEIAEIQYSTGPISINRINQSRQATVTGSIIGRDLNSVMQDVQAAIQDIPIPQGYILEVGGANKEMVDSFISLGKALALAILLVYMILAAQFESLLYPFIIMFSIPPTLIGVVGGLLLTGRTLSVPTFIGIIMLAGIVVNNAIVLVDYINTLRRRGMEKMEAIIQAGPIRLRPILMTTMTTVLGLVPMALGIGEGAEISAGMATSIVFGLTFSTLITLVLVPVIYYILDDISVKFNKKRKAKDCLEENAIPQSN
ncbi:MAG: efflux RND transporter permease subunit [Clostridia bacterium]|nr:efflux RND transporter permease subunit [Clostridia bacterium]